MTQRCIAGGTWLRTISPKSRSSAPSPRGTTRPPKASAPTSTLSPPWSPHGKCQQTLALSVCPNIETMTDETGYGVLTDAQWADLAPLIEQCRPPHKTEHDNLRRTIEAIIWRHENGAKWRSIPPHLGPWWMAAQTFIRWSH